MKEKHRLGVFWKSGPRRAYWKEQTRGNCIRTLQQIREDELGETCRIHKYETNPKFSSEYMNGRRHLQNLGTDARIIM
jgi:hypothetical protein